MITQILAAGLCTALAMVATPRSKAAGRRAVDETFEQVFAESSALKPGFEDAARYNQNFKLTHQRTVEDVDALRSNARILELGAFTGVVAVTLARLGHKVTASDHPFILQDPAISGFFARNGIETCPMNLADIKFPLSDGSFDVVDFHSILSLLNFNPIPLLREFHRLLAPGGYVYCASPNLLAAKNVALMLLRKGYLSPVKHLEWNLREDSALKVGLSWREWTKQEVVELFAASGFELVSHKFGLNTPNRSTFPRKQIVNAVYGAFPSLMPTQIGVFRKV